MRDRRFRRNHMSEVQTASKAKFAGMMGVSRAAVTNWVKTGVLTAEALEGTGPRAKVIVDIARRQVERNRDPGQSIGNGLNTGRGIDGDDDLETRIKQEALRERQFRNRKLAEDEALRQSELLSRAQVERDMRRMIGLMLNRIEGYFPDLAHDIARSCGVPQKDVQHALKKGFADLRARASKAESQVAAALPETVETRIAEVSEC